jgi:hypothetical protein
MGCDSIRLNPANPFDGLSAPVAATECEVDLVRKRPWLRPWMPQHPTEFCSCATESHTSLDLTPPLISHPLDSNIPM